MGETLILDTNVLLHDPRSMFIFKKSHIIIPIAVIEEIDNQKKRQDEVGGNARQVSRFLDQLRQVGSLARGISLEHGGSIRVELNHQQLDRLPYGLSHDKYDNRILAVALGLKIENEKVKLVTKDLNLRIKADALGVETEDYDSDRVDLSELYTGIGVQFLSPDQLDLLYAHSSLNLEGDEQLYPHQFVIAKDSYGGSRSLLSRFYGRKLHLCRHKEPEAWDIHPKNKEQRFALELLLDDSIKLVTLVGTAGTGKTLVALAAGLQKVVEEEVYSRVLVTRPLVPVGNDIGYLPGDKEEKLAPWMQPIYDNLDYLCDVKDNDKDMVAEFKQRGILEIEALTYIRGRTLPKQYIICDEAQNLTPHMVKTLVTRVGEGSKIVFTGDPYQIDNPYLDANSNGLTYLVEKFKAQDIAGHVTLVKGERSILAELGAKLL